MTTTFAQLGLPNALVAALTRRGLVEPFPIQIATIPDALAGRDVSGMAPTGSGKTLAFGLPILARVESADGHRPRALILAPTRELAEQIKRELNPLAKSAGRSVLAVYGGVGYGPQKKGLREGSDILVATPGRLEDLIEQGITDLGHVDIAVVDEADRMADMGFLPAVRRILDGTSARRQTLLFSATLDGDIAVLSRDYQREPVRHEAGTARPETIDARHHFWRVDYHDRIRHTADLITAGGRAIVFTRTRHGADRLAKQLNKLGLGAVPMHGGRSQNQRNRALQAFATGRAQALIATDVAARGIHVEAVASVIHYDFPTDSKDYLHRSGRTARAGATGTVVSLVPGDKQRAARRIQRDLGLDVSIEAPSLDDVHERTHPTDSHATAKQRRARNRVAPTTTGKKVRESGNRESDKGVKSIYVANLPWKTTMREVKALFGRYGKVHQTTIIADNRTGRSKGFGFVDMPATAARAAIAALHGSKLHGRDLTVRLARPRRYGG